jgi:hypothetical protein
VIVPLFLDEVLHIDSAKAEQRAELHDRQFRCASGCVVTDPALGDAESVGDLLSAEQAVHGTVGRWFKDSGEHEPPAVLRHIISVE